MIFQAELKERISEVDDDSVDSPEPPPPVPRRMVGVVRPTSVASEDTITRRSVTAANYENIVKKDRKIFENIGVERRPAVALDGESGTRTPEALIKLKRQNIRVKAGDL